MENIIYFLRSPTVDNLFVENSKYFAEYRDSCFLDVWLAQGKKTVPEAEKQENRVRRKLGQSCGMLPQVIYSTPCSLIKFYAVSRQFKLSHKLGAFLQQRKNLDGVALTEVELTEN